MKLLLDTHVFIWMDISPDKLSDTVRNEILNSENALYLSLASIWELQIKLQLGKLKLNAELKTTLETQEKTNHLLRLHITVDHILALDKLPHHHRDPFDRLLIAQAITDNLTFVTDDKKIQQYGVSTLW